MLHFKLWDFDSDGAHLWPSSWKWLDSEIMLFKTQIDIVLPSGTLSVHDSCWCFSNPTPAVLALPRSRPVSLAPHFPLWSILIFQPLHTTLLDNYLLSISRIALCPVILNRLSSPPISLWKADGPATPCVFFRALLTCMFTTMSPVGPTGL